MSGGPKAELTIFTRTQCGHCSVLKGEILGADGKVTRDPNNAIALIKASKQLRDAGIVVKEYPVSVSSVPEPGFHSIAEFDQDWNSKRVQNKITGFPRLELSSVGDRVNGRKYDEWKTWKGKECADSVVSWALKTLKNGSFLARVSMQDPLVPSDQTDFRSPSVKAIKASSRVPQVIPQKEIKSQRVFLAYNESDDDE